METNQVTATQQADNLTTTQEDAEGYNRASTNAQTRLTVSTFLGSICLGIFGVFLPNSLQITRTDPGSILAVIVEGLLGCASVMFLLMSAALSIVLVRLGDLNFKLRKSLKNGETVPISKQEKSSLDSIIKLYDGVYILSYLGLIAVIISLPIMGFHVNLWVGIIIVIAIIGVLAYFYNSLMFVLFYRTLGIKRSLVPLRRKSVVKGLGK